LGNQNDIHEFIQFFVDSLHEALCYPIKANIKGTVKNQLDRLTLDGHKQWATFYREQYSSIVSLFGGQFISTITCPDCNKRSANFTPEYCFALPIPSKKKGQKEPVDLTDCFRKFIEPEIMDKDNMYNCEKCKLPKQATKQIYLWKNPKILVILLKRFRSHGQHTAKINDMVTYPFNLDLEPFCGSFDSVKNAQYKLYSVCNHQGATGGGHYFAYCKDNDGKWRQYNDSTVSDMTKEKVITKDAYCLFYERL
jgi:ubiquitin carboxyl-terminal hydrolase 8